MAERCLTEKEVRELLCASEDETSNEHDNSSDDDGERDEVLPDSVINSLSSDEEDENGGVTNDSGVKPRDSSEYWSNLPVASNRSRITSKNIVCEKPGPTRFSARMCSSIMDCFIHFSSKQAFLKKYANRPIRKII